MQNDSSTAHKVKKLAIVQSNYIPWKGYFDLIAAVDEFILYDDMQFTKNDWRNRNRIKTARGLEWISIPVGQDIKRRICEVILPTTDWRLKHLKSLEVNYRRAAYFDEIYSLIQPIYHDQSIRTLSALNRVLIEVICNYLNIKTKISYSWDYDLIEGKTERLVSLCQQTESNIYVSGPAASDYLEPAIFHSFDIVVEWFNYDGYQEYEQLWGEFSHNVTILDLLFNCGKKSINYLKMAGKRKHGK